MASTLPPGTRLQRFWKQFRYFVFTGPRVVMGDTLGDFLNEAPRIDIDALPKRTNQTAVMTGGTRGIGFDIVKKLLQLDYTIILGVRNIESGEQGVEQIRKQGVTTGRIKFLNLDLKSLASVRTFACEVLQTPEGSRIDLLLNNAGIMNVPYEKTEDNFESQFQVNYLSHFLLTNLLLPRMKKTAATKNKPCHIVNTTSHAEKGGNIDFDELETSKIYSPVKCYFDSKLCQVIHTKILEKKLQEEGANIHVYSVHPGEIPTDLWLEVKLLGVIRPLLKYICRTTDAAANTVLYPVLNPEIGEKHGGDHFSSGKVIAPNPQVNDADIQSKLWKRSLDLTTSAGIKN